MVSEADEILNEKIAEKNSSASTYRKGNWGKRDNKNDECSPGHP